MNEKQYYILDKPKFHEVAAYLKQYGPKSYKELCNEVMPELNQDRRSEIVKVMLEIGMANIVKWQWLDGVRMRWIGITDDHEAALARTYQERETHRAKGLMKIRECLDKGRKKSGVVQDWRKNWKPKPDQTIHALMGGGNVAR